MVKERLKRKISAWILLSVFIPMLIASSLHIHGGEVTMNDSCHECINHIPHSGHLIAGHMGLHSCILCQFLSIAYLAASSTAVVLFSASSRVDFYFIPQFCQSFQGNNTSGRAPPFSFCLA
ncbi:MAG: hypothetical protein IJ726_07350 [Phocaeicola sp.]|nr:hypothetical protein [Phocaeicola sp.]MBR1720210.1 hypothetical protein [Phocaeicola sp.]